MLIDCIFMPFGKKNHFIPNPAAKPFVPSHLNSPLGRSVNRTWSAIEGQRPKVSVPCGIVLAT